MLYLNKYEIEEVRDRYASHPILGTATAQLEELAAWTNRVSDGWAYWPKPCRAAQRLQEMIQEAERIDRNGGQTEASATGPSEADYAAALRPIKAFRTRYARAQGVEPSSLFTIYDLPSKRLEDLRAALRSESISYGELVELQSLAPYIDPSDVELLEAAGVPEHEAGSTTLRDIAALLKGEVTVELVPTDEARAADLTTGYVVVHGSDWTIYADNPTVFRNGEMIASTEEVPTS